MSPDRATGLVGDLGELRGSAILQGIPARHTSKTMGSSRSLHPLGLVVFGLVGVIAGLVGTVLRGVGGLAFVAMFGFLTVVGLAQFRMSRAMKRASRQASVTPKPQRTRPDHWLPAEPLSFLEIGPDDSPQAPDPIDLATLFLWVFDDAATMSLLNRMNRIGPVHLLRGGGMLTYEVTDLPKMAFGRIDRFIEESEDEVRARIAGFRVRRRLGYYSTLSMVCSDGVWQFAFDRMLERCQVVVVDLSDFTAGRAGIAYEIGVLLDRVPLDQVVFVCGPQTDRPAFKALVESVWDTLAMGSPNRGPKPPEVRLAITTSLPETGDATASKTYTETTRAELDLVVRLVAESANRDPGS